MCQILLVKLSSSLHPVMPDKTSRDFISSIIFIHFPLSMLEIQMSAWDEVFKKRTRQKSFIHYLTLLHISTETFLSSNINIYFFLILSASPIFINNITGKIIVAELPVEIILGSKGSVTEEYALIFLVSPFSF